MHGSPLGLYTRSTVAWSEDTTLNRNCGDPVNCKRAIGLHLGLHRMIPMTNGFLRSASIMLVPSVHIPNLAPITVIRVYSALQY